MDLDILHLGFEGDQAAAVAAPTNDLLLEDGVSYLLFENNDKIAKEI